MKTALLTYLCSAALAVAGDLGFSLMENGDAVEITHHSTGCFHDSTSYYEVIKLNDVYQFRQYAITWDKSYPPKIREKKMIGETALSAADVKGLDELLRFYRGEKEASSTTQDSLLIEYLEPDKRLKTERLKDVSGGYGLDKRKDIVTFYALTERFKKPEAKPAAPSDDKKP